ncbi:MAG: dephospho-CoA kinase, partial [bacterium]
HIQDVVSQSRKSFYVIDAPLLFEAGVDTLCDWTVVITATEESVEKRMEVRGFSSDQIERRRKRQMSEQEKIKRADQVIENNEDLDDLRSEAMELYERIEQRDFNSVDQ